MHKFLGAIGFSNLEKEKNKKNLTEVFHDFDEREVSREGKNKAFVEYTKSFGEKYGNQDVRHHGYGWFPSGVLFPIFSGKKISARKKI